MIYCIFPIIYDFGESKSRLAKVADTESFEEMKNKKLRNIRIRNTFIYKKKIKNIPIRSTFGNYDTETGYAVVARITFRHF